MKRCDKCYRKIEEENRSQDPDLCRPCYRLVHQFDHVRDGIPNDREIWI